MNKYRITWNDGFVTIWETPVQPYAIFARGWSPAGKVPVVIERL